MSLPPELSLDMMASEKLSTQSPEPAVSLINIEVPASDPSWLFVPQVNTETGAKSSKVDMVSAATTDLANPTASESVSLENAASSTILADPTATRVKVEGSEAQEEDDHRVEDFDEEDDLAVGQNRNKGTPQDQTTSKTNILDTDFARAAFELTFVPMDVATTSQSDGVTDAVTISFPSADKVEKMKSALIDLGHGPEFAEAIFEAARKRLRHRVQMEKRKRIDHRFKFQLKKVRKVLKEAEGRLPRKKLVSGKETLLSLQECMSPTLENIREPLPEIAGMASVNESVEEIMQLAEEWDEVDAEQLADWTPQEVARPTPRRRTPAAKSSKCS